MQTTSIRKKQSNLTYNLQADCGLTSVGREQCDLTYNSANYQWRKRAQGPDTQQCKLLVKEGKAMGRRFQTWTIEARQWPQNGRGSPDSANIAVIQSPIVLLARSARPFCWGQFRVEWRLWIPCWVVNCKNSLDIYSPPLLSWSSKIFALSWFSAYAL